MFERAMASMQLHAYAEAAALFRSVLEHFPSERGLLDRARVYLELCQREVARRPAAPLTVEERLTAATAALNNGDESRAERLAREVLGEAPEHDLALYLMAAIAARRGSSEAALSFLGRAIAASPDAAAQARFDGDFESIRGTDAFRRLTDLPALASSAGTRRLRRGRER